MIESIARARQRPYHKHKLVLIYAVMRHFAAELTDLGWTVDYFAEREDFESALQEHIDNRRPTKFRMMHQSEYGVTEKMIAALAGLPCDVTPHTQFISTAKEFDSLHKSPDARVTMETFYHKMRVKTGILVDGDQPRGWRLELRSTKPPTG